MATQATLDVSTKTVVGNKWVDAAVGWWKEGRNDRYLNIKVLKTIPAGAYLQAHPNYKKEFKSQPDVMLGYYETNIEPAK